VQLEYQHPNDKTENYCDLSQPGDTFFLKNPYFGRERFWGGWIFCIVRQLFVGFGPVLYIPNV
jgi:hypothetical protein